VVLRSNPSVAKNMDFWWKGNFIFIIILLLYWGYIVTFTKFLHYIIVEFTPHRHSPLSSPPLIPGIVSTVIICPFHTWVHNISIIFTILYPYLISSPLPLVPTPRQNLFYLSALCFW
jgi:hypothetical protein